MSAALVIGLTGGIGCGKSTVAKLLSGYGANVVDTDVIAQQLTQSTEVLEQIAARLGAHLISEHGLDRAAMRSLVFADPDARLTLESILHPLILRGAVSQLSVPTASYVVLVVPLLLEKSEFRSLVSRILVVDVPEDIQVSRVMQRSALTEMEVRSIMAAQISREHRLAAADDVISNHGDVSTLTSQVLALHHCYSNMAMSSSMDVVTHIE